MGGVWLILYFLIERRKTLFQRALRAIGVGLALFMPAEAFDPKISYQTHLVGFLFGIIFGLGYYMWKRKEFLAAEVTETVFEDTSFDEMLLEEARERARLEEMAEKRETYV
jgi:membrane associated rhomboid family serine protease